MPILVPINTTDCINIFNNYKDDLVTGTYEIDLKFVDLSILPVDIQLFLAEYSKQSMSYLARGNNQLVLGKLYENRFKNLNETWRITDSIVIDIARNSYLNNEMLLLLANDMSLEVRMIVAQKVNLPYECFVKLSKNGFSEVRQLIASNLCTPVDVLKMLSIDSDKEVRIRIAHNINTPSIILQSLIYDVDASIRYNVILNKNTPLSAIEILATDSDNVIREEAQKVLKALKPQGCFEIFTKVFIVLCIILIIGIVIIMVASLK
ncbi:MAG: repeat protein [Bacteroidota bacterium]|nr:repeat protein [Bacteroidota bacterium]